jgi:lipopolysaccharide transport system permease protein
MNPDPRTETVIEPTSGWRFLNARELWAYRDLLWLMVWRDLASRYKQTVLGPLWFIVQPLVTTVVYLVFNKVARIDLGTMPPTLFYLGGLLAWNYFAQTFQSTAVTLVNNAGLFGKVYFPRLIVPLSAVISNLLALAIQLATFAGFYLAFKTTAAAGTFGLSWTVVLLPLLVLQVAAFSLGVGLWIAALTAKFRDFSIVAAFMIQLWLYATPVIYPLAQVPEKWRGLMALNPMTMPVEGFRAALLGTAFPGAGLCALSIGLTLAVVATGVLVFQRIEKNFVDVI